MNIEAMKEIKRLEDKYGLALFRMGLTHYVDVGARHLTDEYVNESIRQIMAEGEKNKANGVITIMTPEFQCEILRCAAELAKHSIWSIFAYIKLNVVIDGCDTETNESSKNSELSREHLVTFANTAIEEIGLLDQDVIRYIKGEERKCFDCGCFHQFIDRFCPECGVLACEGNDGM